MNVKVNFCEEVKLIKSNDICYNDNNKKYVIIKKKKTKEKVLEKLLRVIWVIW